MPRSSLSSVAASLSFVILLWMTPAAQAAEPLQPLGTDPAGDARHHIVPGGDISTVVNPGRTDVLGVAMGQNETHLAVNLTIANLPAGTGGYLYHVRFLNDGEPYFVCFDVQWVGGIHDEENVLGCSRFTAADDGTQVGPGTTGEGVRLGEAEFNGTAAAFVSWAVPAADLGGSVGTITNVTASTWFRGVATCCAPSTTTSRYLWNPSDVAPDAGSWDLVFAPEANGTLEVQVTSELANRTVRPGGYVTFPLGVTLNGTVPDANSTVVLDASGLDDWNWRIEPTELLLNATRPAGQAALNLTVARDRPAGTTAFDVTACVHDAGPCGNLTLAFTIEGDVMPAAEDAEGAASNGTADADANVTADESARLPGPAAPLVIGLAAAVLARRRHPA